MENTANNKSHTQTVIKVSTYALFFIIFITLLIIAKARLNGDFDSIESFQRYIRHFGLFSPLFLTAIQAAQVVLPVLPGFLGCAAGAVMFGCFKGFLCNYIGISLGSAAAFLLSRTYGTRIISALFKGEKYDRWAKRAASSKSFAVLLFIATLLPLFPDDFLCYLAGLTEMSARKFILIIVLGKPWCILAYSFGFSLIG